MPTAAAILLGIFGVAVLVVVAFTLWRLLASLRELAASVARMNEQLAPALNALQRSEAETAQRVARLDATSSRLAANRARLRAGPAGRGPRSSPERTDRGPRA